MLQRGERGRKKKHPCPAKILTMTYFINTVTLLEQCCLEFHK